MAAIFLVHFLRVGGGVENGLGKARRSKPLVMAVKRREKRPTLVTARSLSLGGGLGSVAGSGSCTLPGGGVGAFPGTASFPSSLGDNVGVCAPLPIVGDCAPLGDRGDPTVPELTEFTLCEDWDRERSEKARSPSSAGKRGMAKALAERTPIMREAKRAFENMMMEKSGGNDGTRPEVGFGGAGELRSG